MGPNYHNAFCYSDNRNLVMWSITIRIPIMSFLAIVMFHPEKITKIKINKSNLVYSLSGESIWENRISRHPFLLSRLSALNVVVTMLMEGKADLKH